MNDLEGASYTGRLQGPRRSRVWVIRFRIKGCGLLGLGFRVGSTDNQDNGQKEDAKATFTK